jgi:hypothetical protein
MTQQYKTIDQLPFDRKQFVSFLRIVQEGKILDAQLKIVMEHMLQT